MAMLQAKPISAVRPSSRRALRCVAKASSQNAVAGKVVAAVAAGFVLAHGPAAWADEPRMLADLLRNDFAFVDSSKDGLITRSEIEQISQQVANDNDFTAPPPEVLDFTSRLFDLNQDGKLTVDELLTGLALDSVLSDDAIDEGAVKVFDRNGNGSVDMAEWKAPFGELAPGGEALKEYVFKRVDHLQTEDGKLDINELANGIAIMRNLVLGY